MPEAAVAPQAAPAAPPPAAPKQFELPTEPAADQPAAAPAEGEQTAQNTEEQAPSTAPAEGEKPETPEQAAKREGRRFGRKLDRAYRRAAEAEARAELYAKQLAEAQQARAQPQQDASAPKLENFKTIEEYADAVAKHARDSAAKEITSKQQTAAQQRATAALRQSWETKVEAVDGKYEDYAEVVGDITPTTPWAVAIMKAPNGADVAYHLGKNLEEAQRIASLEPFDQILEIGRISHKLAAEPVKPKTPSRAPAPITPLAGTSPATTKSIYDPETSYDDFVKMRNRQLGRTK